MSAADRGAGTPPVVAFGPELPGFGSWDWVGRDLADELAWHYRTVLFAPWVVPPANLYVVVKQAPPAAWLEQAARRAPGLRGMLFLCPATVENLVMKKRVLLLVAVAVGLLLAWFWLPPFFAPNVEEMAKNPPVPTPGITRANFERIEVGMTEHEVQQILGGPEGYYTDRPVLMPLGGGTAWRWWVGDESIIAVAFATEGMIWMDGRPIKEGTVFEKKYEPLAR
jgi:hypothetical protein